MAGGGAYFGAQTLLAPSIMGTDPAKIVGRAWILPVAGIIGGHLLTAIPKIGALGFGAVGGATAMGVEQIQFAMAIKKQQAPVTATNTGALLEPSDLRSLPAGSGIGGGSGYGQDAGALWTSPQHEAAGLSL
jgi:hypothetical protein